VSAPETTPHAAPSFLERLGPSKRGHPQGPPGPWVIVAAWGPCGYAPLAPGTAGTLGAVPLFWLLRALPLPLYFVTLLGLFAIGVYAAGKAGAYWQEADASPIVIDEVVGYLVTVALVPWSWPAAIAAFVLFRIMDVVKPWPASAFDRMKNGFGVVMDDVAAGVYAFVAYQALCLGLRLTLGCSGGSHFWCAGLFR
jgi:phosphatidylglycerophosphatase A